MKTTQIATETLKTSGRHFFFIIIVKCVEFLYTSDNQFGYESSLSTESCIYTLQEYIAIIIIVTHCKYQSVLVSEHNNDNDLKRQMRKFYANANMIIRKFSKCPVNVKCYLLRLTVQQCIVQLYGLIALRQH